MAGVSPCCVNSLPSGAKALPTHLPFVIVIKPTRCPLKQTYSNFISGDAASCICLNFCGGLFKTTLLLQQTHAPT